MALNSIYFEVLRADVMPSYFVSSAAIVRGLGVMVSANNTVTTVDTDKEMIGCAVEAASAAGEVIPVLIRGKVKIVKNSAVFSGTAATPTAGSVLYMDENGKFHDDVGTTNQIVGTVVYSSGTAATDYFEAEINFSVSVDYTL
jgi:hypothetical protein